jgi:hypothetical protein
MVHDPLDTGVKIRPAPGEWEGPVDLAVTNRTGETLTCVLFEDDTCPALPGFPGTFEPGERWEVLDVNCTVVDVSCTTEEMTAADMPLRGWAWFVQPPLEEL